MPETSRASILVLGGINIDLIATADRIPLPGETVTGDLFYTTPGGKGANQAVAAARMGARVQMVGRVGKDAFGPGLIEDLRTEGIDVSAVAEHAGAASGVAVILLDAERQNYIVQVRGANLAAGEAEVAAVVEALGAADALMLQLEMPFDVSLRAAEAARRAGVPVIWDPAPPSPDMERAIDLVDVIAPNQSEAQFLTGVEVTGPGTAEAAAQMLLDRGVPTVVIKMAETGAYYATAKESGLVPAFRVEVVDSVAAGDAFGGALAVSIAEGRDLRQAVERGCAAGALAVTRPGAQAAMPSRQEVERLVSTLGS